MCHNQTGDILDGTPLKLVDKFTYLGSSVSSTEKDIDTRLTKAWTAIDRLSIIWKSDLTDKIKHSFFQAAVVSILLYGCTTWTLTKRLEKESWRLKGTYGQSNSSEKLSTNADVKNSQRGTVKMKHEVDGDTNCNWCVRNNPQRLGKGTWKT